MTRAEKAAMPRPLKLRALLARLGIKHEDIVPRILQSNGRTLSRTSFSHWLNEGKGLVKTPMEDIKQQVIQYLRDEHVSEADIGSAFEPEETNRIYAVSRTTAPTSLPREPEIKPVEPTVLSQQAKEHFGLTRNPFPTDQSDVQDNADVMLWTNNRFINGSMQSAARTGGLLAIVGESGAGKTILRRKFIADAADRGEELRIIQTKSFDKSKMHAAAICEAIVQDLTPGQTMKNSLEARARQVEDELRKVFASGTRACMLIEEAHDLPIPTLKYLKRFWEIEAGWKRPLSIVLVGQPELLRKLDETQHPELREFIRRCEVAQLTPIDDRIDEYLKFKLERVGVNPKDVYGPDVAQAIRDRLTINTQDGLRSLCYPLVINNLMARAMNDAVSAGERLITREVIMQTRRV